MKTTSICSLTMATPSEATYMWVSKRAMRQSRAEAGRTSAMQNSSARIRRRPTLSANAADKGGAPASLPRRMEVRPHLPISHLSVSKQRLFIRGKLFIPERAGGHSLRPAKSDCLLYTSDAADEEDSVD